MELSNIITLIGPGPKNDSVIKEKKIVRYSYPAYQLAEFSEYFLKVLEHSEHSVTIDLTDVCNDISKRNENGSEMFHSFNVLLSKSYTSENIIDHFIEAKDLLKYTISDEPIRIVSDQVRKELELRKNFNRSISDLRLVYGIIGIIYYDESKYSNDFKDFNNPTIIKLIVKIISNQSDNVKISLINLFETMPQDFVKSLWLYMFSKRENSKNRKYMTRRIKLDPSRTIERSERPLTPFKSYEIFK